MAIKEVKVRTWRTVIMQKLEDYRITEGECWRWGGTCDKGGYGHFMLRGRKWMVHRVAYELFRTRLNEGEFVHHTCQNKDCYNPEHLFPVGSKEHFRLAGSVRWKEGK